MNNHRYQIVSLLASVFAVNVCDNLTESGRVCVSEFCRRCSGVLKENEGEEWGLSKAWERREDEEGGGEGGMSGTVTCTNAHIQSLVKDTTVLPTSMSPSLESIDSRPEREENRFNLLLKQLKASLKY